MIATGRKMDDYYILVNQEHRLCRALEQCSKRQTTEIPHDEAWRFRAGRSNHSFGSQGRSLRGVLLVSTETEPTMSSNRIKANCIQPTFRPTRPSLPIHFAPKEATSDPEGQFKTVNPRLKTGLVMRSATNESLRNYWAMTSEAM